MLTKFPLLDAGTLSGVVTLHMADFVACMCVAHFRAMPSHHELRVCKTIQSVIYVYESKYIHENRTLDTNTLFDHVQHEYNKVNRRRCIRLGLSLTQPFCFSNLFLVSSIKISHSDHASFRRERTKLRRRQSAPCEPRLPFLTHGR